MAFFFIEVITLNSAQLKTLLFQQEFRKGKQEYALNQLTYWIFTTESDCFDHSNSLNFTKILHNAMIFFGANTVLELFPFDL
jgi:hypothetical protein